MNQTFFAGNRAELWRRINNSGPIVIAANGILARNGDVTFPFRQDSNFYYLTGIDEPDLILVIDEAGEYVVAPGRDTSRTTFDGSLDFKALEKVSGIEEILDEKDGWERLKASINKSSELVTLTPASSYDARHGMFANPARSRLVNKLKQLKPAIEIADARKILAEMRVIKQSAEVAEIQRAIDVTATGIKKISRDLASYKYEYEIEAGLSQQFRSSGASGHSFQAIVAGGKNACTLHNIANNSKLKSSDLVVIDVGAEVNNYAADITRTLALSQPSARQQQVYDAVLEVQNFALKLLKPNANFKDYEIAVAEFMGKKLADLKLIKNASAKIEVRRFYPHATSHFLGLDVHDVGDYQKPLAENMVLTCEPGIYIPEEGIGVRIEDDILITKTGAKVLSSKLERELVV